MATSWMDLLGPSTVSSLAQDWDITLTPKLVQFLERFGDRVEAAGRTRQQAARRAQRARADLDLVNDVVRAEVRALRDSLRGPRLAQARELHVRRDVETRLPIAVLRLEALPALVVHVTRAYAAHRRGVTFGFRSLEFCGGRLTGPVARAANYLRESAAESDWMLSVTELFEIWMKAALEISVADRKEAARGPPAPGGKPRPPRKKAARLDDRKKKKPGPTASEPSLLSRKRSMGDSVELGVMFERADGDHSPVRKRKRELQAAGPENLAKAVTQNAEKKKSSPRSLVQGSELPSTKPRKKATSPPSAGSHRVKQDKPNQSSVTGPKRQGGKSASNSTRPEASQASSQKVPGKPAAQPGSDAMNKKFGASGAEIQSGRDGEHSSAQTVLTASVQTAQTASTPSVIAARDTISQLNISGVASQHLVQGQQPMYGTADATMERKEQIVASSCAISPPSDLVTSDTGRQSMEANGQEGITVEQREEVVASGGGPGPVSPGIASDMHGQDGIMFQFGTVEPYPVPHSEEVIASGGGNNVMVERDAGPANAELKNDERKDKTDDTKTVENGEDITISFIAPSFDFPVGPEEIMASGGGNATAQHDDELDASEKAKSAVHEEIVCSGGW